MVMPVLCHIVLSFFYIYIYIFFSVLISLFAVKKISLPIFEVISLRVFLAYLKKVHFSLTVPFLENRRYREALRILEKKMTTKIFSVSLWIWLVILSLFSLSVHLPLYCVFLCRRESEEFKFSRPNKLSSCFFPAFEFGCQLARTVVFVHSTVNVSALSFEISS